MQMTAKFIYIYPKRIHLLPLNSCLDDVKQWISTSKLKLNPDKTEFIMFGSKLFSNGAVHSALLTQSRIWDCGSIQIFPCSSMFRMSVKVIFL